MQATRILVTDTPDMTRDPRGQWSWGRSSAWYRGDRWQDYIDRGGLVKAVDMNSTWQSLNALLLNQPQGALFVNSDTTAVAQINRNYYAGSPTDIPTGFYKIGTRFRVVKPDYKANTLSQYTFELVRATDALKDDYNPKLIDAVEDLEQFIISKIPYIDPMELREVGVWKLRVTETGPLEPVRTGGSAFVDQSESTTDEASTRRNILPLLVSGAGLLTGNPLLIGSGLLLRLFAGRDQ